MRVLTRAKLEKQLVAPPEVLPQQTDLRKWFPAVIDQGPLNTCTAATAAALIGYFEKRAIGHDVSPSILFLYKIQRNLTGQSGDTGSFLRTAMQALRAFGAPPETVWPYRPEMLDLEPAPFHYAYAANYKATHYFRFDDGSVSGDELLQRVRASVAGGLPVMFGLALFDSIDSAVSGDIPLPGPFDTRTALHALVAAGYDDAHVVAGIDSATAAPRFTTGALLVRNSWGTSWGDGGYGWLPYDYVRAGLTSDWWALLRADTLDLADFAQDTNERSPAWRKTNDLQTRNSSAASPAKEGVRPRRASTAAGSATPERKGRGVSTSTRR